MTNHQGFTSKVTDFFWLTVPHRLRRVSTGAVYAVVDGAYTVSWPWLAAYGSLLSLIAGFIIGWWHLGFTVVFSESLLVMALALVIGVIGAHYGFLFVLGFAIGDLLLGGLDRYSLYSAGPMSWVTRLFVPQFIEYALLALLAVSIPLMVKHLLASVPYPAKYARPVMVTCALVGHLALTVAAVYVWAQVVPILMRPLFTWRGVTPTVEMAAVVQTNLAPLLWAAAAASVLRTVGQAVLAARPRAAQKVSAWHQQLLAASPVGPWLADVLPNWLISVGKICITILLLSGVFTGWLEAAAIALVIALIYAAQDGLIPVPLGPWRRMVYRVPLVARVLIGVGIVYGITKGLLAIQSAPSEGFRPTVVAMAVSFLVLYLLNPGGVVRAARKEAHAS